MVIKMYISGISASKEVKKRQLRAQFLLDSFKVKYETIDVSDPINEEARMKMTREATRPQGDSVPPLPPQFYNEDEYCGDYEDFDAANDNDELLTFLKLDADLTIENGDQTGEDDLFVPRTEEEEKAAVQAEAVAKEAKDKEKVAEDEDEDVQVVEVEQVTINGVVYEIPPSRKINVGGREIDVDELLATESEEIALEDVDESLKKGLEAKTNAEANGDAQEEKEEEEE